jgi:hypothetical protein
VRLLFTPISIGLGLLAGLLGRKIFEQLWGLIDDEEPPDAKHREIALAKLVPALLLEGAIFRLVKGLTDHWVRRGYTRLTGSWPGEETPESE